MGILLKQLRVHGFRGLENLEIDFEPMTVLVGTNNAGKTTILKSLQVALSNSFQITDDDFFLSETSHLDKIIIDVLFISVDEEGKQTKVFEDKWTTVFTEGRISFDNDLNQILAFRTVIEENLMRKMFDKKQFVIDEWVDFEDSDGEYWYQKTFKNKLNCNFDEIPFFLLDANRDILDDLKSKTSFLGKILSSLKYNEDDKKEIEELIKKLNETTIDKSDLLKNLLSTIEELDTALDNPDNTVEITPFTKKLRDLNKGVKINYSQFSMEYHGMGTRSWSSLLILKAFILQSQKLADTNKVAYYPIIAIEEPESHLHPNAQKKLYSQIDGIVGQKIVSTHSSYIAGATKLTMIRSIIKFKNTIKIGKVLESNSSNDKNGLYPEEIEKINCQVINTKGELYFSKVIIFCEGLTEEQALPLLIKKHFDKNTIELGIDVVGVRGGQNYFPFIYFADKFQLKWFILSDGEANILNKLKKDIKRLRNLDEKDEDIVLPENIIHYDNGCNFEDYLIDSGYTDEIERCLKTVLKITDDEGLTEKICNKNAKKPKKPTKKICEECKQNIYEYEDVCSGNSDKEWYKSGLKDLLSENKTKYPSVLSDLICKSKKSLPSKLLELFKQIEPILSKGHTNE